MDTHFVGDATLDSAAALRACLPGEPEPGLGAALPDDPSRIDTRAVPPAAIEPGPHRRRALLAGVAIAAVAVIVGGGFLMSPYNKVVPVPPELSAVVFRAEAQIALLWHHVMPGRPPLYTASPERTAAAAPAPRPAAPASPQPAAPAPLAPAAALADIHPTTPPPAVVQPPYRPQPQEQELAEVLKLGGSAKPPATALSTGPAKPEPAHAQPPKPGAPPAAGVTPVVPSTGLASPPPGYVPHEPGTAPAIAATPVAETAPPAGTGVAGHPEPLPPPARPTLAPGAQTADRGLDARAPGADHAPGGAGVAPEEAPPPLAKAPEDSGATETAGAAHVVAVTPPDALGAARDLRAAPMSSDQQVQVLELVTQLATLIRDQRTQITNLQADVQRSAGATSAKLSDFERRLALVEAGTAMAAASGPPTTQPSAGTPTGADKPPTVPAALLSAREALDGAGQPPPATSIAQLGPQAASAPKQYRVQAASPGLAMLAEVDRGGGDGAQVAVQVGDTVPGYGRVLSVGQRGTSWVVQTEHGTIQ